MNTICNRWKENKMWDKLSTLKTIFMEPKDHRENHQVMEEYRSVIEKSSTQSFRDSCGALLFAVFRGKMAEGIDFSDNEARCVLAVSNILKIKLILFIYSHACTYTFTYYM